MGARIRIAVTLGDPRGIGPEVMTHAARSLRDERPDVEVVLLGDSEPFPGDPPSPERALEFAGRSSLDAIRRGTELALSGEVAALVTGPVHKPALHAAGARVPGQTELLRDLAGARHVGMLMHAETTRLEHPLRILLATTHLALRDVPASLSVDLLYDQILLLDRSLRDRWRIAAPLITVCALNPHASDGGLFGDEEERLFLPAIRAAQAEGARVRGPLPADTAFLTMVEGEADAVVVPYHDVGMAVFKTLAFGHGVNVTLGLPFVRTSPDHGTAFDLVGTGKADSGSALAALRLATRLARRESHAA